MAEVSEKYHKTPDIPDEEESTTGDLKKSMKEWADGATINGLTNVVNTKSKLKRVLFLIFIFAFLFGAAWYAVDRFSNYLQFDAATKYEKFYADEETKHLKFPNVLICNYNRFYYNEHSLRKRLEESMESFYEEFGVHIEPYVLAVHDDSWIPVVMGLTNATSGVSIIRQRYDQIYSSARASSSSNTTSENSELKHISYENYTEFVLEQLHILEQKHYYWDHREEIHDKIQIAQDMLHLISREYHTEQRDENGEVQHEEWHLNEEEIHVEGTYNAYDEMEHSFYDDPQPLEFNFQEHYENSESSESAHRSIEEVKRELQTDIFHMPEEFIHKYDNLTLSEVLDSSGWHINDHSVFSVSFRKKEFEPSEVLNNHITSQGNCFEFHHSYDQATAGPGNGLKISLNVMQDFYTEHVVGDDISFNDIQPEAGLSVYIYNPKEKFPDFQHRIDILPGTKATIAVTNFTYEMAVKPWGICDEETNSEELHNYSLAECLESCYIENVIKSCGCKPHSALGYTIWKETPECNLLHMTNPQCRSEISILKNKIEPNFCNCYQPCHSLGYKTSTTYSQFPSKYMIDNFEEHFSDIAGFLQEGTNETKEEFHDNIERHLRENMVYLDIYYEDLKFTLVEESRSDYEVDLISDMGGTFGLWLGMSLWTIVELVYCMCYTCPKNVCGRTFGCIRKKGKKEIV